MQIPKLCPDFKLLISISSYFTILQFTLQFSIPNPSYEEAPIHTDLQLAWMIKLVHIEVRLRQLEVFVIVVLVDDFLHFHDGDGAGAGSLLLFRVPPAPNLKALSVTAGA